MHDRGGTRHRARRRGGAAVVLAVALLAASCSGDDGETTAAATSPDPSGAESASTTSPVTSAPTTVAATAPSASTTTAVVTSTTTNTATTSTTGPRRPAIGAATLEGPITTGALSPPAAPRPVDLAAIGYVEEEYFASGTATAYAAAGEITPEGNWAVSPTSTAPYRTRFVLRRPADPSRFNGVVVMEWLNVTVVEAAPEWTYTNRAIVDAGAAWLGVSVQALGVVGGDSLLSTGTGQEDAQAGGGLRGNNPERYGTLEHPGDQYAFDIYSQIGAALRSGPTLDGVQSVIAAGESQSAAYLTTYINAIQPISNVFDGFFVHSRGSGAARLEGVAGMQAPAGYRFRTDLDAPIMVFEAETDVGPLLGYANARQPDTDLLRVWEAAGTAHADAYLVGGSFPGCPGAINDGPQHYVTNAAMAALLAWVVDGAPPARGEPIATDPADPTSIQRDAHGLALGGVRTPSVDVPVATLTGDSPAEAPVLCRLFGGSTPFDQATLVSLYGSKDAYVAAFDIALDEAIAAGFVRAADRDEYAAEARAIEF
jgi:hypothetical protein